MTEESRSKNDRSLREMPSPSPYETPDLVSVTMAYPAIASTKKPLSYNDLYALVAVAVDRQSRAQSAAATDQAPSVEELSDIVSQVAKISKEDALAVLHDYQSGKLSASEQKAIIEFSGRQPTALQSGHVQKKQRWGGYGSMGVCMQANPLKTGVVVGGLAYLAALASPLGGVVGFAAAMGVLWSSGTALLAYGNRWQTPSYHLYRFNQSLDDIESSPSLFDREARTQAAFKDFYNSLLKAGNSCWTPRGFDGERLYERLHELKVPLRDGARVLERICSEGNHFIYPEDRDRRHELEVHAVSYLESISYYQVPLDDALSILSQTAKRVATRNPKEIVDRSINVIDSAQKYVVRR